MVDLKAYNKAWRLTNKERLLDLRLRKRFGLSLVEYNLMVEAQNGRCKICKRFPIKKALAVDHCHQTNKVRGLLCMNCNVGIAHFKESVELLREAQQYLKG